MSGASANTAHADTSGAHPFGLKVFGLAAIAAILFAGLLIQLNVKGWRDRLLHRAQPSGNAADVSMIKSRPSIAVLGFKNVSGRRDGILKRREEQKRVTLEERFRYKRSRSNEINMGALGPKP